MIRKIFVLLLFIAGLRFSVYADWLTVDTVGTGVIHYHQYFDSVPWHIHVIEVQLAGEGPELQTVKASDRVAGNEQTSAMVRRSSGSGNQVLAAVNGDFYHRGGIPVGAQAIDGILLKQPYPGRSLLAYRSDHKVFIDTAVSRGRVITANQRTAQITGLNEQRGENALILFNQYFGEQTGANYWGTEIIASYLDMPETIDEQALLVVTAKDSINEPGHGNNPIAQNGVVLSGHGQAARFLNRHVFIGDTIQITLELFLEHRMVQEVIGGLPRLIRDGAISIEWQTEGASESFTYNRHPRTAAGIAADSTKIYLFTVDGRQEGYSMGMSLFELADYMMGWDIEQGINLDGGGSTTMVVEGAVVNSPSDKTGERAVSNALMVVNQGAPVSGKERGVKPQNVTITPGDCLRFTFDTGRQMINKDQSDEVQLQWTCSAEIGSIDERGFFRAAEATGSGIVVAEYQSISDTAFVRIMRALKIK